MTRSPSRSLLVLVFFGATLSAQRAPIAQQLTFAPYHANGIYELGETVGWTVTPGPTAPTYPYKWTIRRNNSVVLKEGKLDLSTGKATIEIVADQPEMIYVAVEAYDDGSPVPTPPPNAGASRFTGGNTGRNTGFYAVGAAVSPRKIGLSTPRPADFDAFWESKLAAQAKVPINAALTLVETGCAGRGVECVPARCAGIKSAWLRGQAGQRGQVPRSHPAAVCRRLRVERRRCGTARR